MKFAGLGSGGIEKYLQSFAKVLKEDGHEVDFFYTNAATIRGTSWIHPPNDELRKKMVESWGIKTIPIHVEYRVHNTWHETNFFDIFNENDYDLLITAGNGQPEFPYTELKKIKIIHSVHGDHVFNQENIIQYILICNWQAERWINNGGNKNKLKIIPPIVPEIHNYAKNFREKNSIPQNAFVFGIHQRNDPTIYNPTCLLAFEQIPIDNNYFIFMGGSQQHREIIKQFSKEKQSRIKFIDFCSDPLEIHSFLNSIDVYSHSRLDGEVCSASIIEAMSHGKPVITCPGYNNGHKEQIENCGFFCENLKEYQNRMIDLSKDKEFYNSHKEKTLFKYQNEYSYIKIKNQILQTINQSI